MNIEHITNTNPANSNDSILRLCDFDASEACQFRDILAGLANGSVSRVELKSFSFVHVSADCDLILTVGQKNKGVVILSDNVFECVLTKEKWKDAECLVQPFCEGNMTGYQWLYDLNTDVELLFSPSGRW